MIGVVEKNDVDRQEPPTVIKIGVTRSGANAIARMAKKYGMQKQEIGGRIYDWFMAQDSIVQRAVLGLLEGLEVDAARRFMERLADGALPPGVEKVVTTPRGAKAKTPAREPEPGDSQKRR